MLRPFLTVLQSVHRRLRIMRDPVGYARSLGVRLGSDVHFYGMDAGMFGSEPWLITIGNHVHITAGVTFVTHDGGTLILRQEVPDLEWTAPISVGDQVYIGIRSILLPGVRIGNRCIIGAGSIVSRSIPDNSVAAGTPARVIRSVDEYLDKMQAKSLHCGHLKPGEKAHVLREIFGVAAA